jgi:hypothetical protein
LKTQQRPGALLHFVKSFLGVGNLQTRVLMTWFKSRIDKYF